MPACSPNFFADISNKKRIQALTTMFVICIRHLPYDEPLQRRGQGCSLFAANPTTNPEGTNATDKASTPRLGPPTGQSEGLPRPFFHPREAHLRLPPPFWFFAPETSKPTPDRIATLVVTQFATAPHHCTAPLPTEPPCPTNSSPAAAFAKVIVSFFHFILIRYS